MANLGVDYSFGRPDPAAIKGAGYTFVCRYLASDAGKRIAPDELAQLQAENLDIVLVFEDNVNQALSGFAQGVADAQEALNQAGAVHWPGNLPIYFAVDFDATEAQQAQIDDYFRGVASIMGLGRVGVYGGFYIVQRCLNNGTATFAWQTTAWSGGQVDPRVHIYQNGNSAFNGSCDVDEARQTNFGQWTQEDDEVIKPSAQQVADAYLKHNLNPDGTATPATQADLDYYSSQDVAVLYAVLLDHETNLVHEFTSKPGTTPPSSSGSENIPVTVNPPSTPSTPLPGLTNNVPTPPTPPKPIVSEPFPQSNKISSFFQSVWKALFG